MSNYIEFQVHVDNVAVRYYSIFCQDLVDDFYKACAENENKNVEVVMLNVQAILNQATYRQIERHIINTSKGN